MCVKRRNEEITCYPRSAPRSQNSNTLGTKLLRFEAKKYKVTRNNSNLINGIERYLTIKGRKGFLDLLNDVKIRIQAINNNILEDYVILTRRSNFTKSLP